MPERLLYTIGHSNHEVSSFFALLQKFRVCGLVDVRSIPSSGRFPQFKRHQLERLCKDRGITYRHCPELGNKLGGIYHLLQRPEGQEALQDLIACSRGCGKPDGDWDERHRWVAFMCAESDWTDCHRQVIAHVLAEEHGVTVRHIKRDGTCQEHPKGYEVCASLQAQLLQPPPTDEEVATVLGRRPASGAFSLDDSMPPPPKSGGPAARGSHVCASAPGEALIAAGAKSRGVESEEARLSGVGNELSALDAVASPVDAELPQVIKRRWGKKKDCC